MKRQPQAGIHNACRIGHMGQIHDDLRRHRLTTYGPDGLGSRVLGLGHWAQQEATEVEAFCPRGLREMRAVARASLHSARNRPVITPGQRGDFPVETARM